MGSGHETTNRSVGRAHGCMTWRYFIELFSIKTALPHERVGSGHETRKGTDCLSCLAHMPLPTSEK